MRYLLSLLLNFALEQMYTIMKGLENQVGLELKSGRYQI
jgi:hypothetical protein